MHRIDRFIVDCPSFEDFRLRVRALSKKEKGDVTERRGYGNAYRLNSARRDSTLHKARENGVVRICPTVEGEQAPEENPQTAPRGHRFACALVR